MTTFFPFPHIFLGMASGHDTIGRDYQQNFRHTNYGGDIPMSHLTNSRRHSTSAIQLVYPNMQVHCLDIDVNLRGVSLQTKAGDLLAVMATSSQDGTVLMETLAGLRDRISGEILINGQRISQHGLRNLCSYVPAPDKCALDPRMSVKSTLNFYASLRGSSDSMNSKQHVNICSNFLSVQENLQYLPNFNFFPDKYSDRRLRSNSRSNIEHIAPNPIGKAALMRCLPIVNRANGIDIGPNHHQYGYI